MSEETIKIGIDTLNYYKNKKTSSELEEVPIDILRCMYLDLLHNVEQLEKIIEEMATYIGKIDVSEDLCDDSICHEGDNCNKCIIDHFRKKCE